MAHAKIRRMFIALATCALSGCALSFDEGADVPPMSWAERNPTYEEYRDTYPENAAIRGITGRVQMMCLIQQDRTLACDVVSETPVGVGFGAAALRLSTYYVVRADHPTARPGQYVPLGVRYQF